MNKALIAIFFAATGMCAHAQSSTASPAASPATLSPVGLWKTVDDETGITKSEVRLTEADGVVSGRIERLVDPTVRQDSKCIECRDDRKDQPVIGMEILRGLKKVDGKDEWEGGTVLDPKNGKVYKATLVPLEDGKKLQMRGYFGFFYRTQVWIRVQ